MSTARWLGVAPWDLARQPLAWREIAAMCAEAEAHACEVNAPTS